MRPGSEPPSRSGVTYRVAVTEGSTVPTTYGVEHAQAGTSRIRNAPRPTRASATATAVRAVSAVQSTGSSRTRGSQPHGGIPRGPARRVNNGPQAPTPPPPGTGAPPRGNPPPPPPHK